MATEGWKFLKSVYILQKKLGTSRKNKIKITSGWYLLNPGGSLDWFFFFYVSPFTNFLSVLSPLSVHLLSSASSVLICLIIPFSVCLVQACFVLHRTVPVSRWRFDLTKIWRINMGFKFSSGCQCAPVLEWIKGECVVQSFGVFSPDYDISIVYRPLRACLSPNRDSGRSKNIQSHRQTVYHIRTSQFCVCVCVCVFFTVHVLLSKIEDSVLIANVASYLKYWMFSNKVEIWVLNGLPGSAREYNGTGGGGVGVKDRDKERLSIKWMTSTSQLRSDCSWHFVLLIN